MKYCLTGLMACMLIAPVNSISESMIKEGQVLSINDCINIARKSHPSVIASMNSISISESRVGEAQSNYYPQISGSAGYNRASLPASYGKSASDNISMDNSANQYSAGVTLNQTIFDFWKTPAQVKIMKFGVDSARWDFEYSTIQIEYNVKVAYFNLLQAIKNREVAKEIVEQNTHHLNQARGYYEVKMKPKYDLIAAEVNLSNARLNLIKSENAIRNARAVLNNALGINGNPDYIIEESLTYSKAVHDTLENLILTAFKNRPDFRSFQTRTRAAEENITLARTGYMPVLSGSAAYNRSGAAFPLPSEWHAGLSVSMPLFSGFLTTNQVREAKANLNLVKSNEDILKNQIVLDVQQAVIGIREAEETIPTAELAVSQARENLDIANGRYQAGVGSPVEVSDAQVSYINAKQSHIQALVSYNIARAGLEKAIGVKK